jgi:hypothetical protein
VKTIDLIGQRFGYLIVLGHGGYAKDGKRLWKVKCDCGTVKTVRTHSLTQGGTISCGCYGKIKSITHGAARRGKISSEYKRWADMIARCENPNNKEYANYGGRGISVCPQWRSSFETFLNDMGTLPSDKYKIDRIDVDKNYTPENTRWVNSWQNATNRRVFSNNHLKIKGVRRHGNKFQARVQLKGKAVLCKLFPTLIEAAAAYNEAAKKYHGEYAHLNDLESLNEQR